MEKLGKLYVNSASTKILQRSKIDFIENNNQMFPNNPHIHLLTNDAESTYYCPLLIIVSNIPNVTVF